MPASLALGFDTIVKLPKLFEFESDPDPDPDPDPQEINKRQKLRVKIRNIITIAKKTLQILSYIRGFGKTITVEYRFSATHLFDDKFFAPSPAKNLSLTYGSHTLYRLLFEHSPARLSCELSLSRLRSKSCNGSHLCGHLPIRLKVFCS